ncbi:MAG: hypothetical protein ACAH17_00535 [Candidatus Paceibacterota bacterium]
MDTETFLKEQPGILLPEYGKELEVPGTSPLISLRGNCYWHGTDTHTWIVNTVETLRALGYTGTIYVPRHQGELIPDEDRNIELSGKNDRRAFGASVINIFYQPEDLEVDLDIFVPFLLEAERQARSGKKVYVIGADSPGELGLMDDSHFKVHGTVAEVCQVAYEKYLHPLKS